MTEATLREQVKIYLAPDEAMQLATLAASYGVTRQQVIRQLVEAEYKKWLRADARR